MPDDDTSVRVAVRIRPQVPREVIDMCRVCTSVTPDEPQVTLGQDKSFTFDLVFDTIVQQREVYESCVQGLVYSSLDGYNATVLAYGQTGSGKTYTMGTAFDVELLKDEMGIIPRAINDLFQGIEVRLQEARANNLIPPEFKVVAQFMELYNEDIIDLFDPARDPYGSKSLNGRIKIHEDVAGGIKVSGVTLKPVCSASEAMQCLRLGALSRTTAATGMNAQSSRSHAVFTLHIKQQRLVRMEEEDIDANTNIDPSTEFETLSAKFHFVDLAGSERLKRTGATGERAKEGISINCGLLALGNVISALGDKSKKVSHVPYRDSKLTRLLQDSLGGNSQTLMIACISPSDRDFMETLNTLKYANRARNIKNKIIVNQDKSSRTISVLRQEIAQLQLELLEFKQGKRIITENGEEGINDMFHENTVLQSELNNLRTRVKAMQGTIDQLSQKNSELLAERAMSSWIKVEDENESMSGVAEMIQNYLKEIEDLRSKLFEANAMYDLIKKSHATASKQQQMSKSLILGSESLLDTSSLVLNNAKKELYRDKEILARSMGEMEYSRKLSQSTLSSRMSEMGEREGAEGESGGDSEESEDEGSDSEYDSDSENKVCQALGVELTSLSGDIDTKQRLIEELELSQRRLHSMRRHYEDKLMALHTQIKLTQEERDKVLASYGTQMTQPTEKVKRVKDEYERKISDMQREMKRLQAAQKEHSKLIRSQQSCDNQIRAMKNELTDMKRNKVKLLHKMKEESLRHKQTEGIRTREIAQLRKESRKTANVIKTLEADKKLKEQILKRKQEEVTALRRGNKQNMSNKVAGRRPDHKSFSSKSAKAKWQNIEKTISKVTINKQAICDMERDMERLLNDRESLGKELERLKHQKNNAIENRLDTSEIENEIDSVKSNIEYIQDSITESQHHIMQIEEAKDSSDQGDIQILVNRIVDLGEARYIIEKLYNLTINNIYEASQKDVQLKDSQAKLQEMQAESHQQSVLRQMLAGSSGRELISLLSSPTTTLCSNNNEISSGTSTRSVSPVDSSLVELAAKFNNIQNSMNNHSIDISIGVPPPGGNSEKSPIQSFTRNTTNRGSVRLREIGVIGRGDKKQTENAPMTQSMSGEVESTPRGQPLARVPSAPGSLRGLTPQKVYPVSDSPGPDLPRPSPFLSRKAYNNLSFSNDTPPLISPRLNRRQFPERQGSFTMQNPLVGKPGSMEAGLDSCTPPGSPPPQRRNRDENVFSRLTGNNYIQDHYVGGFIKEFSNKSSERSALRCTHIAEGHSSAVLSLCATDDMLLSAATDRTVKVWDLTTGQQQHTLLGHPNNVVAVRYDPLTRLVFSVSGAYVRVWDLRSSPVRAIKTLCSSGITQSSIVPLTAVSRSVQLPAGETQIYDIMLNKQGTSLYTTSNDKVRIWDLRMFECSGKLSTGHQAAVMCLAVGPLTDVDDIVVTGSKDHYIKVFEVSGSGIGSNKQSVPRLHLEPPHYDGIQCLALNEGVLFSGSRDTSIKKWHLNSQTTQTLCNAHKGWVMGLALLKGGDLLVSGCRSGQLKLWDANTCKQLALIKADNFAINDIATNSNQIFTASNSGEVKIWRCPMAEQ
ncbi:kinesin-like protein 31E isoform X2 [Arctopsyche grandis]|uniref:kinesin-like protein 31E isoform X2 n=1 Tax=Arctopsyche grandis TaxID=121162 RepID=UPI00406D847F